MKTAVSSGLYHFHVLGRMDATLCYNRRLWKRIQADSSRESPQARQKCKAGSNNYL